jgi:hypothetical protein
VYQTPAAKTIQYKKAHNWKHANTACSSYGPFNQAFKGRIASASVALE